MIRLVLPEPVVAEVERHLLSAAPLEQGAFCLLRRGRGIRGERLLATGPFLPGREAWEAQGPHMLRPTAQAISAAVSRASVARSGLLFIHSHPDPLHPEGLSTVDLAAFEDLARTVAPILDGPFAAAVVHPAGWSASAWTRDGLVRVDRILGIGRVLRFLSKPPRVREQALDDRQRPALGRVHPVLRSLAVAVVGCGGLGSPTAEQLVRMGVAEVLLVDLDRLDTDSNVRRVFGARVKHLKRKPLKVDIVGDHLAGIGLGVPVRRLPEDVRGENAFRALLDVDVVLGCTDTHGSRAMLNELPSAYLLPVIDAGVRAGAKPDGELAGLLAEVRVLTPTTPCLLCRGVIDPEVVRIENLPPAERERLRREGYVLGGAGQPEPSVVALTVLGSGLAACALLGLLSAEAAVAPPGYWVDGFLGDACETAPSAPRPDCRCRARHGLGDDAALAFWALPPVSSRES